MTDRMTSDTIIDWVSDFLWEMDEANNEPGRRGMLERKAAEIIVNQILILLNYLKDSEHKEPYPLPSPALIFHNREVR